MTNVNKKSNAKDIFDTLCLNYEGNIKVRESK